MLSRSLGKIFCAKAFSCCLNSSAGYLASTCTQDKAIVAKLLTLLRLSAHCAMERSQPVITYMVLGRCDLEASRELFDFLRSTANEGGYFPWGVCTLWLSCRGLTLS